MIDHTGVPVRDYAASRSFYTQALSPLGYAMLMEYGDAAGFGDTAPDFWIESAGQQEQEGGGVHVAFRAESREAVEGFHRAALAAGGRDNGAPGFRDDYGPGYYAAYVFDPDGNNVEAVWHTGGCAHGASETP